jgi:GntR family transcriptional regulator / MocR family aminotransferase
VSRLCAYCRTSSRDGLVIGFGGPTDAQLERAVEVLERSLARGPSATGSPAPGALLGVQRTAPRWRTT